MKFHPDAPWVEGAPKELEAGMQVITLRGRGDGAEECSTLVGDVNELGGVCDDCRDFCAKDVIRWRQALTETEDI